MKKSSFFFYFVVSGKAEVASKCWTGFYLDPSKTCSDRWIIWQRLTTGVNETDRVPSKTGVGSTEMENSVAVKSCWWSAVLSSWEHQFLSEH